MLDKKFGDHWIGRYSVNHWPARSPDLRPLDFFLWGYLKIKVNREIPFRRVAHLEQCIRDWVYAINQGALRNIQREMNFGTVKCMERDGGHVEF